MTLENEMGMQLGEQNRILEGGSKRCKMSAGRLWVQQRHFFGLFKFEHINFGQLAEPINILIDAFWGHPSKGNHRPSLVYVIIQRMLLETDHVDDK